MASVDRPRPAMVNRPRKGSWDTLLTRSRRSGSMGDSRRPQPNTAARPQSTTEILVERMRPRSRVVPRPASSAVDVAVTGPVPSSPATRPVKPRMMVHHPDQRDSAGFAGHMAAVNSSNNNGSSPRKPGRALRSSDSMPELNLGAASGKTSYFTTDQPDLPKTTKLNARPSRLAESMSMSDFESAQRAPDPPSQPPPRTERRMRAKSWHGKQPPPDPSPFQQAPLPPVAPRSISENEWRRADMARRRQAPNDMFNRLPQEVLTMVVGHLRTRHLVGSSSCATCWLRDGCSIALSNKKWRKASQVVMYEDIQLVGPDSALQRKKYKGVFATRLVLLRRTLRADPKLAAMVRFLKVPALPDDAPMEATQYHDIVASVVVACTNLERLDGFYPIYNHSESRLFSALTSRTALRDMTWIVDAARVEVEVPRGHKAKLSKGKNRHSKHRSSISTMMSYNPTPQQTYLPAVFANKFVRNHMNWPQLTHLTIHCLPGAQLNTPNRLLNVVQTYLISLQSLHLSHIPPEAFDDATLLGLPKPLKKLTLSHCAGISTIGLSTFATTSRAQALEKLTLLHQNLESLPAIVRLLGNLSNLTTFSLVQASAPTLPNDDMVMLMPYLGSRSLQHLHWDVFDSALKNRSGDTPGTKTDDLLARSIAANGFPKLRSIRIPCDPDGKFQALCRPKERVQLPSDHFRPSAAPVIKKQVSTGALRSLARDPAPLPTTITKPYASSQATGLLGPYSSSALSLVLPTVASSDDGRPASMDGRPSTALSHHSSSGGGGGGTLPVREAGSDLHRARWLAQSRLEAARGFPLFEANITDADGILVESTGLAGFVGDIKSHISYNLEPDASASDEHGGLPCLLDLLSDRGEDLYGKGDVASRSGAGFGTGCVASEHARTQAAHEEETAAVATAVKSKGRGISKITKSAKEKKPKEGEAEERIKVCEGCTGRWNSFYAEHSTTDRWAHTERGRWRGRANLS